MRSSWGRAGGRGLRSAEQQTTGRILTPCSSFIYHFKQNTVCVYSDTMQHPYFLFKFVCMVCVCERVMWLPYRSKRDDWQAVENGLSMWLHSHSGEVCACESYFTEETMSCLTAALWREIFFLTVERHINEKMEGSEGHCEEGSLCLIVAEWSKLDL